MYRPARGSGAAGSTSPGRVGVEDWVGVRVGVKARVRVRARVKMRARPRPGLAILYYR